MAVPYYGDFAEDDTVNLPFNTFDSNDPSNSVTATDLVDSDIFVHKDGSATAITTDGATIDIDAPGVGAHMITVDTSVHADYATGSEYAVRINGVTVDGGTVNAWIGAFSIERAGGVLALIKATTLTAILTDTETGITERATLLTDTEAILLDTGTTLLADTEALLVDTEAIIIDTEAAITERSTLLTDTEAILVDSNSLNDVAISELAQTAPSATPTLKNAVMLLYMALRNKTTVQTSGTDALEINNDAGTIICKKLLTDDGADYSEAEMVSGP